MFSNPKIIERANKRHVTTVVHKLFGEEDSMTGAPTMIMDRLNTDTKGAYHARQTSDNSNSIVQVNMLDDTSQGFDQYKEKNTLNEKLRMQLVNNRPSDFDW